MDLSLRSIKIKNWPADTIDHDHNVDVHKDVHYQNNHLWFA